MADTRAATPAGRFWWDRARPIDVDEYPLRAVIFDLDALTDIECDGHRVVYNAAFAAHGLDFEWSVARYRQLLALSDERQRVAAELRARGICTESDVLTKLLADEIYTTKTMMFEEMIADADLAPRPGLVDLVMDAFAAGVRVAVVTSGQRSWAEPLVRQLVGEGLVETMVTTEDVSKPVRGLSTRTGRTRDGPAERTGDHGLGYGAARRELRGSGRRGRHRLRCRPGFPRRRGGPRGLQWRRAATHRELPTPARALVGASRSGQLRSISMTALKSLSAWSAANLA